MSGPAPPRLLRLVAPSRPVQPDPLGGVAAAAASGDRRAVRTFLLTVTPHLLRVVRRVLGPEHPDVDDVAQESAYALMEALPRHRGECTVLHFACRVALLTAMNVRRRDATRKRMAIRQDDAVDLLASSTPPPDEELAARALARAMRELLDALPIEQAEALGMHFVLGYTVREIADSCRVPAETVRSRLRLAKDALRKLIAGDPQLGMLVGDEA